MASRRGVNLTSDITRQLLRLLPIKSGYKKWLSVVVILVAVVGYVLFDSNTSDSNALPETGGHQTSGHQTGEHQKKINIPPAGVYKVSRVIDGDTIEIQDNFGVKYRIRLIGSNAPETAKPNAPAEPFAVQATNFTKTLIERNGNQARIAFDGDRVDKYDRILALVNINTPQGEICLNEILIKEGLARARLQYNYSDYSKERFRKAEQNAKNARRNIWRQQSRKR
ncbi:MAG: thermonuclease family protein [Planctomycetaceae bacterium]|jgi:endonuclease YncB( thermonuclease family)|nr:thermonuclease family protein [Planctomycetaceae bacterium]